MQITKPDYYDSFSCIAGACSDTCCALWRVVLDEERAALYRAAEGALGEQMRAGMIELDGETCFALQNGRCCMLREDGLCEIQRQLGEEALSQTCGFYPRFVTELGLTREQGLSISCPEAARLILSKTEPVQYVTEVNQEPLRYFHDLDPERFLYIKQTSVALRKLAQDRSQSLAQRLHGILTLTEEVREQSDASLRDEMYARILSLQALRPEWTQCVQAAKVRQGIERLDESVVWEQLLCYYLYRYTLRAAMDDDFEEKIRLAVFQVLFLQDLYAQTGGDLIPLIQRYAKETEHNEENLELLQEGLPSADALCAALRRFF